MGLWLISLPMILAAAALAVRSNRMRPWLLPVGGLMHLAMTAASLRRLPLACGDWLVLDALGGLVLAVISLLFAACSVYAVGYLRHRSDRDNRVFTACLLCLLSMMSLVTWSHHWGLMWVAMEATTLASAPLIFFNRTAASLEAGWKYLLVCSVGIALALLGSFFLAYAALHRGVAASLLFDDLLAAAPHLSAPWLKAAFVLLLVGYGTKMGLAPMHGWKPDAYGEAPGIAGALLAGGLTSCALLMVLRIYHLCDAAGQGASARSMLLMLGLASMAFAAASMPGQSDFKRLLAWSSVEHMGILALGLGIGGIAILPALLHLVNNALTKGVLFLSAGNIHRAYGSKSLSEVRGALRRVPLSGSLLLIGFLAITGSPPFGPFVSEFGILSSAVRLGHWPTAIIAVVLLMAVFLGMGRAVLGVTQGRPATAPEPTGGYRDSWATGAPIVLLAACVLLLGVYMPAWVREMLTQAAAYLESRPA